MIVQNSCQDYQVLMEPLRGSEDGGIWHSSIYGIPMGFRKKYLLMLLKIPDGIR